MAFTVTFPASGPPCAVGALSEWLTERGESFSEEGTDTLVLRALPVRFVASPDSASLLAQLEVTSSAAISRMVDVLFEVSMRAGADVSLAGHGPMTRAALWMRLADEQDRLRIAESLERALEHGNRDEIHKRLWAVLATLRQGRDDRWDTAQQRVVELVEVGDDLSLEEAAWHADEPKAGDVIPVPVIGFLHCLVWRWLSEAYPGIAEAEHTLHWRSPMIVGLDHIAIAVPELDEAIRRFTEDLGIALDHVEDVPSAKTRTAFLPVAGPTLIELVTPLNGEGPIATSLDKRGPGLHHLCFRTDDLDGDVARLRERGWRFTADAPMAGAHGTRVMFIHPKSTGGVLIELAEHPR